MAFDFGGLMSGLGSIANGIFGFIGNERTNKVNKEIAGDNLDFQRENLDYQKALQQRIFEREDTAYSRTVSDLRNAGLNPLAMQGTNGSGEAIATEAMHNDFRRDDTAMQNALGTIFNSFQVANSMANNNTLTRAQANLINAQANNQNIKNLYEEDLLTNTLSELKYSNIGKQFENERSRLAWQNDLRNYSFLNNYGLSENMPEIVKLSLLRTGNKGFTNKQNLSNFYSPKNLGSQSLPQLHSDTSKLNGALMQDKLVESLFSILTGAGSRLFGGR